MKPGTEYKTSEKTRKRCKEYYREHRAEMLDYQHRYRKDNAKPIADWREKNREYSRAYQRAKRREGKGEPDARPETR